MWVSAVDPDDRFHESSSALLARAAEFSVPLACLDLTLYEVANAISTGRGQPDFAEEIAAEVAWACGDLVTQVDSELVGAATKFAGEHGITVYDAAYVVASRTCQWPFVSCDLKDLVRPGFAVLPADALASANPAEPRQTT